MGLLKKITDVEGLTSLLKARHGKRFGKARLKHGQEEDSEDDDSTPTEPDANQHKDTKVFKSWEQRSNDFVRFRTRQQDHWPSRAAQDQEERALGVWLINQRQGKRQLDQGITDSRRVQGMTWERVAWLDEHLPGWEGDGVNTWKERLENLAWDYL